MARHITLKNPLRENYLFRNRAVIAGVVALILMLSLMARLVYLQIINHQHFTTLSHNNRVSILPLAPTRGLIFDRNGVVLAENLPSFSLEIIPERVEDMESTLTEVAKLVDVSDQDLKRFREALKHKRRFENIPLRFRLSNDEVARVAVNLHRLPGVEINSRLTRHYPLGPLTAHAIGYVGRINEQELQSLDVSNYSATTHIGKVGIEKSYEDLLHGSVGYQQVETNARGRILRVLEQTPPVPGKNLHLNIDVRLQRVAEQAFDGERGALVALDPNNGAVLALVSMPGYDSNLFVNGIDQATYTSLTRSHDRPLFNRALRGQYPPGSTLKPFIGLAGLELNAISASSSVFCPGYFTLEHDDHRYRDWKKSGHGPVDLTKSIVESCDVFFYDLGLKLGIDRIASYLKNFGFGKKTGIDIVGESGGLLPSREWKRRARQEPWYPGETLITSIGQGFTLTTPLQLASGTATLATRGIHMQPEVLNHVVDPTDNSKQVLPPSPEKPVPIKDIKRWERIISAMEKVVDDVHGTAHRIKKGLKYTVAGKTGTAQVFGIKQDEEYQEEELIKRLRDHALFIAFAPVESPRIAVALIVENGGHGSSTAAPIARKVMDSYLLDEEGNLKP